VKVALHWAAVFRGFSAVPLPRSSRERQFALISSVSEPSNCPEAFPWDICGG
jgi:hypothetical protein